MVLTKQINIIVPLDWEYPKNMIYFTPEENALILTMGSELIKESRNLAMTLSQKEIYDKVREETKEEIDKLESDLLVEKKMQLQMDTNNRLFYEKQIEQLRNQMEMMRNMLSKYESGNKEILDKEINNAVSNIETKYNAIIETKDKTINNLTTNYEKIYTCLQSNKSTQHKGRSGENTFEYYANETFRDFSGYRLLDKHNQGGLGDFHLNFSEYDVLVDAKNYTRKVPIDQREKIKNDLLRNEHLTFAWLVSLNTSIDKYDKSAVMYEWINAKQCIVYINNLLDNDDPRKMLRIVWFTCKELCKLVKDVDDEHVDFEELKNVKYVLMDKIKTMRKRIREINTSMNVTKNLIQSMDEELKDVLTNETEEIVNSNYSVFDEWWNVNIEVTNVDSDVLVSSEMWIKFRQENKKLINDYDVNVDKFKQYLKAKIPHTKMIFKSKTSKSSFELKGIKYKNVSSLKSKKTASLFYFDEILDKKIIDEYMDENNDVISISENNNINVWEVISLLVKRKVINNRTESRGYDKYKETAEYKMKLSSK
jgi:hypothetical protein